MKSVFELHSRGFVLRQLRRTDAQKSWLETKKIALFLPGFSAW
jgi:hypothetical protein